MNYQSFSKAMPISKVDEATHEVIGLVCDETIDGEGEICDFWAQKPYFCAWSDSALQATTAAGIGPSKGNIRVQHDATRIGGRVTDIQYRDEARQVWLTTEPTPEVWPLIETGMVTSYSQAGSYVRRWCDTCGTDIPRGNDCPQCLKTVPVRYCARLAEVSYVDRGSNPNATFTFVRTDGQTEMRKFRADPAASMAGTWQEDSTGFEADGIPHNVFIPPLPESDLTGFEGQGLPDDPTKPADWSITSSDDMAGDSVGFEQMRKQCLF